MNKSKYALAMLILSFLVIFNSCKDDEETPTPSTERENIVIEINDNQTFNLNNFLASYSQLFVADNRWSWDFTHDFDGDRAVKTHQNMKILGDFGKSTMVIDHKYNSLGYIESSSRTSEQYPEDLLRFTYVFNKNGRIVELTKYKKGDFEETVDMSYDDNGYLVKKVHKDESGTITKTEEFENDADGNVTKYTEGDDTYTYIYENGNMVKETYDNMGSGYTTFYEYDAEGRMVKSYEDGSSSEYSEVIYHDDYLLFNYYSDGRIEYSQKMAKGLKTLSEMNYSYDDQDQFEYAKEVLKDENGKTSEKRYLEGSIDNLNLVGYSKIDSRINNQGKKTKESVYDADDTKLYYIEYVVAQGDIIETKWFKADGTSISEDDVTEDWVFVLIQ